MKTGSCSFLNLVHIEQKMSTLENANEVIPNSDDIYKISKSWSSKLRRKFLSGPLSAEFV